MASTSKQLSIIVSLISLSVASVGCGPLGAGDGCACTVTVNGATSELGCGECDVVGGQAVSCTERGVEDVDSCAGVGSMDLCDPPREISEDQTDECTGACSWVTSFPEERTWCAPSCSSNADCDAVFGAGAYACSGTRCEKRCETDRDCSGNGFRTECFRANSGGMCG